jgi:murein DD-endopeptidase MepM/ murein hydrolase activator NlpD
VIEASRSVLATRLSRSIRRLAIAIVLTSPAVTANAFALDGAPQNEPRPVLSPLTDGQRVDFYSAPPGTSETVPRDRIHPASCFAHYSDRSEGNWHSAYTAAWFAPAQQSSGADFSFDGGSLGAAPFMMPVDGAHVSSPFGMRIHPGTSVLQEHTGVDLAVAVGTPVRAAAPGTVEATGFDKHGYGRYVVLQHAAGYSTWYAHLSAIAAHLRAGMQLRLGQRLGAVGRTGDATGPHLHFEVRYNHEPTDPLLLIRGRVAPALIGSELNALQRQISSVRQAFEIQLPQNQPATSDTGDRDPMQLHAC